MWNKFSKILAEIFVSEIMNVIPDNSVLFHSVFVDDIGCSLNQKYE